MVIYIFTSLIPAISRSPNERGGVSGGVIPILRVLDATVQCVDQGADKRPGAITVYLEPWHADIVSFLEAKKNRGKEELKARNLFYALWVPDILSDISVHFNEVPYLR